MRAAPETPSVLVGKLWIKLSLVLAVATVLFEITTNRLSRPVIIAFDHAYDRVICGGDAAMSHGDKLSELALGPLGPAAAGHAEANPYYVKAYACGIPDAGIRLVVAHCMGFGTPKNAQKARQILREIEQKYPHKIHLAGDARKACEF